MAVRSHAISAEEVPPVTGDVKEHRYPAGYLATNSGVLVFPVGVSYPRFHGAS